MSHIQEGSPDGAIDREKSVSDIRQTPYVLPDECVFCLECAACVDFTSLIAGSMQV